MRVAGNVPRVGCLGVGWIGRQRMRALVDSGAADVVALADASPEACRQALPDAPGAKVVGDLDALLAEELDGLMIATPSALHAEQARRALAAGVAVFCQKPLARSGDESAAVVAAARQADRRLGVDFSYRHVAGVAQLRERLQAGALGRVFAVDLVFHNAYGPDKPWFHDPALAGGGCVVDLGIHLVDLALWQLDWPAVEDVHAVVQRRGAALDPRAPACEDFACATLALAGGVSARLACSWNLHAGRDAVIEASFYGTEGAARLVNVEGSFYDFRAEHLRGTTREVVAEPPDAWGGRAAVAWARALARSPAFDPEVERAVAVARVLDRIYQSAWQNARPRPGHMTRDPR